MYWQEGFSASGGIVFGCTACILLETQQLMRSTFMFELSYDEAYESYKCYNIGLFNVDGP